MIVLMGVAGAGKSMQGRMLADERGYAWISTGEILRVLVTGKRRMEMLEGKLLSDNEIIRLIDRVFDLIDLREEIVLDGFPRTIPQADWLVEQAHNGRFELSAVIHLSASPNMMRKRLMARGRQDDTKEAIDERFREYDAVTLPIIEHLKQENVPVYDIDAGMSPREVHDRIVQCLNGKE